MKIHIALKTLLACSLMLVVAGCYSKPQYHSGNNNVQLEKLQLYLSTLSSKSICAHAALKSHPSISLQNSWGIGSARYPDYVTQAKRRGYTPQSCAKLLGRTTQVASSSRTTYISKPSDDAAQWDQYRLCTTALKSGAVAWETTPALRSRVTEAKRRGYTPESCGKALGRTTQVATGNDVAISLLANWGPKKLCKTALNTDGSAWTTQKVYLRYITEAKRRGYTPESCARALGSTTQVASSSTSPPNRNLCNLALIAPGRPLAWDTSTSFIHIVGELKRQGYTPESCARVLGRTTQVASSSTTKAGDYQKGLDAYRKGDWAAARREWDPLAQQGHAYAQFRLGWFHEYGQGTPKNYKTARKWYQLAAKQGRSDAASRLARMYHYGIGVTQNYITALRWYRDAGDVTSMRQVKILEKQIARQKSSPTVIAEKKPTTSSDNELALWAKNSLCKYALVWLLTNDRGTVWDTSSFYGKYVTEAKRRGYTPESCAKVLGRTTQIAKKSEPNKTKTPPKPQAAPELTTLDEAYVALKSANVRKGPGTVFKKVASLVKGEAITALGKVKDQDWYLIVKAGKKLGYVYGNLIAPEASQQAATPKPTPQPTKVATTKASTPRLASTSDIHFGKYHALVIGNNDYLHLPDLKTAMADAKAVKEVLVNDYGFDTKLLLNATEDDIVEALDGYRERLQYDDNLLIYYAGHGVLDETQDRGYWLPVDANEDTRSRWVANDDITANLRSISAKHILVVADSCYSGTLTRSVSIKTNPKAERTSLIRQFVKQKVRVALTSGGLEPVVDSGGGGHSVFAEAFLDALKANTDVLLGHELYTKIRGRVHLNAPQLPRYDNIRFSGHKEGDFLFVSKRTLKASVEEPTQADMLFWQSVKDSTDPEMFREYLKQFPDGMFAGLARIRIKELVAAR